MSKKRTSAEANNDEETNEGSDASLQQEDNAKRAKLTSWSDTTLQDLPIELLEYILLHAVVEEVTTMKAKKSVWKEKADIVISRLSAVCSQWSSILTTDFFRSEVHRILDGVGQADSHVEVCFECQIRSEVLAITAMREHVFMLRRQHATDYAIHMYTRKPALDVLKVICLPGIVPEDLASCGSTNAVYILSVDRQSRVVHRINSPEDCELLRGWISGIILPSSTLSVSIQGQVIVLSNDKIPKPTTVSIYGVDGVLQQRVFLDPDIYGFESVSSVFIKPSGNIILSVINQVHRRCILELNEAGEQIRHYESKLSAHSTANLADRYGTIMLCDGGWKVELIDHRCFPLKVTGQSLCCGQMSPQRVAMNSDKGEFIRICTLVATNTTIVTIFRFVDDE